MMCALAARDRESIRGHVLASKSLIIRRIDRVVKGGGLASALPQAERVEPTEAECRQRGSRKNEHGNHRPCDVEYHADQRECDHSG
jgi:hypothetical protein